MAAGRGRAFKRLVVGLLMIAGLFFAIEGGEFGTHDLLRQRRESARLTHAVDSLQRLVDSLRVYRDAVEHDPATQERIAREVFGMVRGDKEVVYWFTPPRTQTP